MARPVALIVGGARSVSRRGLRATLTLVREEVQRHLYVRDVHVWYRLDTQAERPQFELKPHLRLVRGTASDADRLAELPTISPEHGRRRIESGAELWLVLDDQDRAAFACWIFYGATPVLAAPDGMLPLPEKVGSLEDSVTSPDHRGQGIAPATWQRVADDLAARDVPTMLTTVGVENIPSTKAVKKAGFVAYGVVRYTRRGPSRRIEAWTDGTPLAEHLRQGLRATRPAEPSPVALPQA